MGYHLPYKHVWPPQVSLISYYRQLINIVSSQTENIMHVNPYQHTRTHTHTHHKTADRQTKIKRIPKKAAGGVPQGIERLCWVPGCLEPLTKKSPISVYLYFTLNTSYRTTVNHTSPIEYNPTSPLLYRGPYKRRPGCSQWNH